MRSWVVVASRVLGPERGDETIARLHASKALARDADDVDLYLPEQHTSAVMARSKR